MNILYIASVFDEECIKKRLQNKPVLPYAASKYNTLLFEGMVKNGARVSMLSIVPINRKYYKKLFFKGYARKKKNLKICFLTQVNLPIIKNLFNIISCFFRTLFAPKNTVVVYDVLVVSASIGALGAAKLRGFKKVGIVTDLPKFQPISKNSFMLKANDKLIASSDAFVFLTKQMNEEVNISGKPHIILEGHADELMKEKEHASFSDCERNIVYAGSLEKIYGIEMLCKAFLEVALPNEYLHIYGDGDFAEDIILIAKANPNIIYHGNRPNTEVVDAELNATLLVNPRPTDGEYTRFSFPSKTLEYMVSGTPVLSSRLEGIPAEYDDYIFYFNENNKESLGEQIRNVLDMPLNELKEKGERAKTFAIKNKNNVVQAKKILDFCESICSKEV